MKIRSAIPVAILVLSLLQIDSALASSISDCKITRPDLVTHQSVGWPRDPDRLPSIGTVKMLILAVDFEDAPYNYSLIANLPQRMQLGTIKDFYKSVSNGLFKPEFEVFPFVVRMPKTSEKYGDSAESDPLVDGEFASHLITHDALTQIQSRINLNEYSAVIVVVTDGHSLSGRVAFALSTDHDRNDHVPGELHNEIVVGNKAFELSDVIPWRMLVHEINHLLGIADLYLYSPDGYWQGKSPGPFGQQGFIRGDSASDSLAYNRWLRGWIPESRVLCVNIANSSKTISLETQNRISGKYELVLQRVSDTKVIAFETLKNKGFSSQTYSNSILIYSIDSTIPIGQGPVRLIAKVNPVTTSPLTPSLPDWERYKTAALLPGEWVRSNGLVYVNKPLKSGAKYVDLAILVGKDAKAKTITCLRKSSSGTLQVKRTGYFPKCPIGYLQSR